MIQLNRLRGKTDAPLNAKSTATGQPSAARAAQLNSDVTELRPRDRTGDRVAIDIERVSVRYGDRMALGTVSMNVRQNRVMAFIGPSGCGKTSLLKCLNRLHDLTPECRVEGRISLFGEDVLGRNVDLIGLRRRVGMVFQRPNPFPFSIYKNLELPLREHGMPRARIADSIQASLEAVGLWSEIKDRLNAPATSLSGGQQQRLCIARALILEPEVILFDEPCSALDPISCASIEGLIQQLRGKFTVVIVTHNLAQARRLADDVAFFWVKNCAGQLVEYGPAEDIFENAQSDLTSAYLQGIAG